MAGSSKPGSPPTISDVAAEAGVSIKTISRVMNHEPGVRQETRDHVTRIVQALNYSPKQSARSLGGSRSFLIGLLYYDPSAAFVGRVQQGATLRCREAGYHLVVESLHNTGPELELQVGRMVAALRPDGMILTPPLCDDPHVLRALRESATPVVLISPARRLPGCASVRMDDLRAAADITDLLLDLGHRRLAFVKGAADQAASGLRYTGFQRAMAARGLQVDPKLVCDGDFTFASGVAAADRLLRSRRPPTAVFASNDDMALGVLASAQRLGVAVPDELSIAGFDDSVASALVWPALTTVRQPMDEMGRVAVDMLIGPQRADAAKAAFEQPKPQRVVAYDVVVRGSTADVPATEARRPRPIGVRKKAGSEEPV